MYICTYNICRIYVHITYNIGPQYVHITYDTYRYYCVLTWYEQQSQPQSNLSHHDYQMLN